MLNCSGAQRLVFMECETDLFAGHFMVTFGVDSWKEGEMKE
jgi:hypothetical protein